MGRLPRSAPACRAWRGMSRGARFGHRARFGPRARFGHLARRFAGALSRRPPRAADEVWATSLLLTGEAELWKRMSNQDRRHSIEVARRYTAAAPKNKLGESPRDEMAAALLHDVGKLASALGTTARVIATITGPRTKRFALYHDHERIGADMLVAAGSSAVTVGLVDGTSDRRDAQKALRLADDV